MGSFPTGDLSVRGLDSRYYVFSRWDTARSNGCLQGFCVGDTVNVRSGRSGRVEGLFDDSTVALRGADNRLYLFRANELSTGTFSPGCLSSVCVGDFVVTPSGGAGTVESFFVAQNQVRVRGFDDRSYTFSLHDVSSPRITSRGININDSVLVRRAAAGCQGRFWVGQHVFVRTGGEGTVAGFFDDGMVAVRGFDQKIYLFSERDLSN